MNWVLFLVGGRILVYLWMKFPLPDKIKKIQFIEKLHICDLCSGMWVYTFLAFFTKTSLMTLCGINYVPVVSEVVTGAFATYVVWVFIGGLNARFMEIHLNG